MDKFCIAYLMFNSTWSGSNGVMGYTGIMPTGNISAVCSGNGFSGMCYVLANSVNIVFSLPKTGWYRCTLTFFCN